tara:strand:- start:325 stop:693 length:369 start_codon:yes stop_codon:yes gene_type:complete
MALGNANNSAQSRGKNRPIIVKRRKEVVAAKNYIRFSCSPPMRHADVNAACSINTASGLTETYYHDGARPLPRNGAKVYTRKHANERYYLPAGYYKTSDGVSNVAFEVDRAGTVGNVTLCRS